MIEQLEIRKKSILDQLEKRKQEIENHAKEERTKLASVIFKLQLSNADISTLFNEKNDFKFLKEKKEIEKIIGKITKEKSNVELPTAKEPNFSTGILQVSLDEKNLTKDIQQFGTLICTLPAPKFTGKQNVGSNAIEISWGEIPKSADFVAKLSYELQLGRKEKEINWKSEWKGKERKCRIANLEYNTKYVARVRVFLDDNTNIVGEWSQQLEILFTSKKDPQPIEKVKV